MLTVKELLLSRSALPRVGVYTLKEHLAASDITITATPVGAIKITKEVEEIRISDTVKQVVVTPYILTLKVSPSILYPTIVVQEQLNIIISQD
jgi:hypothetical protein